IAEVARSRWTATSPRPRRCTLPATWKSPESSARRSQSDSGAIAASSLRRSSESTFELQQPALVLDAIRPVRAEVACGDDAMTRDEQAEAVARAEASRRTRRAGRSSERGELPIGDDLAARNRSERLCAAGEERTFVLEVDGNLVEPDVLAGEIRLDPLDELQVTTCYLVGPGRVRELVPDDAALGDDELPD